MNNHNTPPNPRKQRAREAMENHTPKGSWQAMEEAAERDLAKGVAEKAEEQREGFRQEVFAKRSIAENDRAEYELFGSRGRTFYDPKTGEKIADANNPTMGLIEQMRIDLSYGRTEAERVAYADAYESRIMGLVDDGLELAQARLIADFELKDMAKRGKLIRERISNGEPDSLKAARQVDAQLARLATQRQKAIVEGGALTMEDYDKLRKGQDLYGDVNTPPSTNEEEQKQSEKKTEVLKQAVESSRRRLVEAKNNLEQQRGGLFHRKAMKTAREALDDANEEMVKTEALYLAESMKSDVEEVKRLSAEAGEDAETTHQRIAALVASEVVNSLYETGNKTSESLQEDQKERSWVERMGAKIGSWFSKGKEGGKWAKQGGTGLALGAAVIVTGTAWPITTAVSLGTGFLMGEYVRQGQLEENAKSERMSEELRNDMKEYLGKSLASAKDLDEQIKNGLDYVGHQSSADSVERNAKINKEKKLAMARYAIGFGIGGALAGIHSVFSGHNAVSGNTLGDSLRGSVDKVMDKVPTPASGANVIDIAHRVASTAVEQVGGQIDIAQIMGSAATPWDAFMQLTGGDPSTTATKLIEAVTNTPGAQWHSLGMNGLPDASSWISVNGVSATPQVVGDLIQNVKF